MFLSIFFFEILIQLFIDTIKILKFHLKFLIEFILQAAKNLFLNQLKEFIIITESSYIPFANLINYKFLYVILGDDNLFNENWKRTLFFRGKSCLKSQLSVNYIYATTLDVDFEDFFYCIPESYTVFFWLIKRVEIVKFSVHRING